MRVTNPNLLNPINEEAEKVRTLLTKSLTSGQSSRQNDAIAYSSQAANDVTDGIAPSEQTETQSKFERIVRYFQYQIDSHGYNLLNPSAVERLIRINVDREDHRPSEWHSHKCWSFAMYEEAFSHLSRAVKKQPKVRGRAFTDVFGRKDFIAILKQPGQIGKASKSHVRIIRWRQDRQSAGFEQFENSRFKGTAIDQFLKKGYTFNDESFMEIGLKDGRYINVRFLDPVYSGLCERRVVSQLFYCSISGANYQNTISSEANSFDYYSLQSGFIVDRRGNVLFKGNGLDLITAALPTSESYMGMLYSGYLRYSSYAVDVEDEIEDEKPSHAQMYGAVARHDGVTQEQAMRALEFAHKFLQSVTGTDLITIDHEDSNNISHALRVLDEMQSK